MHFKYVSCIEGLYNFIAKRLRGMMRLIKIKMTFLSARPSMWLGIGVRITYVALDRAILLNGLVQSVPEVYIFRAHTPAHF